LFHKGERNMAKPGRPKKQTEVHDGNLGPERTMDLSEIGDPGPIEKVAETDFVDAAELEAFMNEILTVVVAKSAEDGALEVITPSVNGINQPIICGEKCKIKRKYVEGLARARTIKYDQQVQDPTRPENIQMIERSAVSYPFTVIHDPNPKGPAWLAAIQAQP
jgi:hypothetical protein